MATLSASAFATCTLGLGALLLAGVAAAQECRATSGAKRAALVELYTSEGCSSCPPADRQLARIGAARDGANADTAAVPLALHVDFWDYIGWKDPYAHPDFSRRQRMLVAANGGRASYTPHFFVNGQEIRDRSRVEAAIRMHSARPAGADLELRALPDGSGRLQVSARVRSVRPERAGGSPVLYVAVTESGLANRIQAGENRGAMLEHDHVVRHWFGPLPLEGGRGVFERAIAWTPAQRRKGLAAIAFVQDAVSGEVLQALSTGPCKETS
jgi:hypothetical protein